VKQKKNPLEKKMKVYGMSLIDNLDNNMIIQFAESIAKVLKMKIIIKKKEIKQWQNQSM
jgi:hypothetical protein